MNSDRIEKQARAARFAKEWFPTLELADSENPYLKSKGIPPMGDMRRVEARDAIQAMRDAGIVNDKGKTPVEYTHGELLVIPLFDEAYELVNLQLIELIKKEDDSYDSFKVPLTGGLYKDVFFPIQSKLGDEAGTLLVGEGVATIVSACLSTGYAGMAAINAGNLMGVAVAMRREFPERDIILVADNDYQTDDGKERPDVRPIQKKGERFDNTFNTGVVCAREAAQAIGGGLVISPRLEGKHKSDFNDLHVLQGEEAVAKVINAKVIYYDAPESKLPEDAQTAAIGAASKKAPIVSVDINYFLQKTYPPKENILDPILQTKGLMMICASRGLGKTFFGLTLALAIAGGRDVFNGRFKVSKPWRVLYIDGEMPANTMQERMASILHGLNLEKIEEGFFRLITPDEQSDCMPNIGSKAGQAMVNDDIDRYEREVIILDNLATLCRNGKDNDAESWLPVQEFLLDLRRRDKSVILIHHTGKNGTQRGTSAKEDILDTVLLLQRPSDYDPAEGARFEVHFSKCRNLSGQESSAFELRLEKTETGGFIWHDYDIEDLILPEIIEMKKKGCSIRNIADETNIPKSTVQRLLKKHGF